jgi:multidrug resistance efflux pump
LSYRRIALINIVAFVIIIGLVYVLWDYYYQNSRYVSTDNAYVSGQQIPLNVEYPGKLLNWTGTSGQQVTAGQLLGKVDTSVELQSIGALAKNTKVANAVKSAAQIKSPIDGTLIRPAATVGQMATPQSPLGYVVNLKQLYVIANIKESDVRHVDVGDTVDVSLDALPNQTLKGVVLSIGQYTNSLFALIPPSDVASGTYTKVTQTVPVKISLNGYAGDKVLPGMNATVHIHRKNN